MFVTNMALHN